MLPTAITYRKAVKPHVPGWTYPFRMARRDQHYNAQKYAGAGRRGTVLVFNLK
jgi:hypothetical protein